MFDEAVEQLTKVVNIVAGITHEHVVSNGKPKYTDITSRDYLIALAVISALGREKKKCDLTKEPTKS